MINRRAVIVQEHLGMAKPERAREIEKRFRVPMEESMWPGIVWIACIAPWETTVVSDEEAAQVASYIDFMIDGFYGGDGYRFARDVRELPLPLAPGHNSVIFVKRDDGWGYRRASWETGSWPHAYRAMKGCPQEAMTLVQVLDKVNTHGGSSPDEKWVAWKADHPAVFPS